jgi:hypothetical protein
MRPPDTRNLPVGRHREICKRDRLAGAIEREDKGSLHALQGCRQPHVAQALGRWRAWDSRGLLLGLYETQAAASAAVLAEVRP